MTTRLIALALMTTAAASGLASAALADPPARVGRISYVEGEVSLQPPQSQDWTDAFVNYPVTSTEAFWTGDRGRVELQMGAIHVRLDNDTSVDITDLRYGATYLALSQGSINVQIPVMPRGGVGVMTPAGEIHLDRVGLYRIDVSAPTDDGSYPQTEVTVFEGLAHTPGAIGEAELDPGQAGVLYAGYDPEVQPAREAPIDQWSRERAAAERWRAEADFSPDLTGAEDMNQYGVFVPSAQYGRVWFPTTVPGDWAPYHNGHWAYVAPWGYTWIDDQPWGFTPFHYGRWVRVDGRWGWVRGQVEVEPVYAPALVAFVGGGGWSIGASFGGAAAVGWIPLGPQEVYRPPYQVSDEYVRRVNTASVRPQVLETVIINKNVTNITINNYQNGGAATVMRADAMSHGAQVRTAAVTVSPAVLARAPAARISVVAPPAREALGGGVRPGGQAPRPAPPPPAKLAAVRAAVSAPPSATGKPPVIAGARITPPQPHASGVPIRTPAAQAQGRPTPTPVAPPARASAPPIRAAEPEAAHRADQPAAEPRTFPPTAPAPVAGPGRTPPVVTRAPMETAPAPRAQPPMAHTPMSQTPMAHAPMAHTPPSPASREDAPRTPPPSGEARRPVAPVTAAAPPRPAEEAPKPKPKPDRERGDHSPTP